jgi:hypothetical protein
MQFLQEKSKAQKLQEMSDDAYAREDFLLAEELDVLLESLYIQAEATILDTEADCNEEGYFSDIDQAASIDELLCQVWHDYHHKDTYGEDSKLTDLLWGAVLEGCGNTIARIIPDRSRVSDKQLLEAAEDAYQTKIRRIDNYRKLRHENR